MNTSVIFLDIDGVICTYNFMSRFDMDDFKNGVPWFERLDPECLKRLKKIVDAADADIVLSSSWRHYRPMVEAIEIALKENGLPVLAGQTTRDLSDDQRAEQIQQFLDEHKEITHFVIIDDWPQACIDGHFVQTDPKCGLTDVDADRAIQILRMDKPIAGGR